ncbi:Uma2 family endonuclease [Streptomyces sp. S186]|uniref:Uma2 family endonuclease n=1 Tax=Streptomyces sp. S186 TaxID=3434395 RepID=UPI003F67FAE4
MAAVDDRLRWQIEAEVFEDLARQMSSREDAPRLEFINGRVGYKDAPDGNHGMIIQWLTRICLQARPELWLHRQGLEIATYRDQRVYPDGVLAPGDAFVGAREWTDPSRVLMAVEVTLYDADSDRRNRELKPPAYAATGIPVYLLIDRDRREATVHSEPAGDRYRVTATVRVGERVTLPAPVGIDLDTEPLKDWVR